MGSGSDRFCKNGQNRSATSLACAHELDLPVVIGVLVDLEIVRVLGILGNVHGAQLVVTEDHLVHLQCYQRIGH